jgi:hypothetical protein
MNLVPCHSVAVAQAVLSLLSICLRDSDVPVGRAYYATYQNGRELGFTVVVHHPDDSPSRSVSFSEERCSDHIVVYRENGACSGLDEAAYRSGRYFMPDDISGAAAYCSRYLLTGEVS